MGLFNFGKKKENMTPDCNCHSEAVVEKRSSQREERVSCCCGEPVDGICCIKVLGAGCKSCHEQFENAKSAVSRMGLDVEVQYITDMEKVMEYGIMSMPALVINEKVVSTGKILKASDVEKLLRG